MTEQDIVAAIEKDPWMMQVLKAAEELDLPDWQIGAGFVRSKVWDILHNYTKRTPLPDIDLIYFDKSEFSKIDISKYSTDFENKYRKKLSKLMPDVPWSVTNQARMHVFHNDKPYRSSVEGLSRWVETATCVGVKLEKNKVILAAPLGIEDLVNLILRPNPKNKSGIQTFKTRIKEKEWLKKWPKLKIVYN